MHIFFVLRTVRIGAKVFMDMISGKDTKNLSAAEKKKVILNRIKDDL